MSAKAQKAVEDALVVAAQLTAEGRYREAEIIRRVCKSNSTYRSTLGQLWRDNMALRGEEPDPRMPALSDGEIGDKLAGVATGGGGCASPTLYEKTYNPIVEHNPRAFAEEYEGWVWCDQCDRRVSPAKAIICASPFCKAKVKAA